MSRQFLGEKKTAFRSPDYTDSKKDVLGKSRLTGPAAGTGVQCFYNYLELLDSLRARGPMGRRPAGVYPVLDTGPE